MKSKYPNKKYKITHYRSNYDDINIEFEHIGSESESECVMSVRLSHIKDIYSLDPFLLTNSIYANSKDKVVYVPKELPKELPN